MEHVVTFDEVTTINLMLDIKSIIGGHQPANGALPNRLAKALKKIDPSEYEEPDLEGLQDMVELLQAYEERLTQLGEEVKKLKTYKRNARMSARNYQKAYQELERRVLKLTIED